MLLHSDRSLCSARNLTGGRPEGPASEPQIHLFPCELGFCLFAGKGVIAGTLGNNSIRHLLAGATAGCAEFVCG